MRPLITPLDPLHAFWPHVSVYDKQIEMILSIRDAVESIAVAGNQLGKDFIGGYIAYSFFKWPYLYFDPNYAWDVEQRRTPGNDPHTRRVLTTSVKDEHLDVLWGEIGRWVKTCSFDQFSGDDAIVMLHHEIRFKWEQDSKNPINYLKGQVSAKGEGMAGHHAAYTLGMGDESSGLDDEVHKQFQGWAKRRFYFGNPNPCQNFWRTNYTEGDVLA